MKPDERQLALDQLTSSEAHLLALLPGLTPAQWHFRESVGRWSIAENIEHLISFESFIRTAVLNALNNPPEPHKQLEAPAREPLVLGLANARHIKFTAREATSPKGRWSNPIAMIEELRDARAQTLAFAAQTQLPLRDHFFPHIAFGDLDCYQWLLILGQHTLRHALQIEQIKADPAYPAA